MSTVQGIAKVVGLGLGSHVKPTNNDRKEVRPHGVDRITGVSGDGDEVVKIYQGVYNGEQESDQRPEDVHGHGDRPLPGASGRLAKDLPVSIVLWQNDQGGEKAGFGADAERDMLEGGKG
jgi:hypothetical protein